MPKKSTTIGAYFYAEDYVRFCSNLKYYLSLDLKLVSASQSKHHKDLYKKGEKVVYVGILDDVEIVFLHYKDKNKIIEKWKRRIERINWDNIILKFSYQNECTDDLVQKFLELKNYRKFVLIGEPITRSEDEILYKRSYGKIIIDETENFDLYVKPLELLNNRFK